jgi:predicted acetyltransferase
MKLVKPSKKYELQVMEYRNEFISNGEDLAGTSYLRQYEDYEEWLKFVRDNELEETKHSEVAASVLLAIREDDDRLIGFTNIRHDLNDYLFNYGGHIGYSVRKEERRKGYATEILKQTLEECRRIGVTRVLLTCDKSNIASCKVIQANNGELENEVMNDGELIQRYWINF